MVWDVSEGDGSVEVAAPIQPNEFFDRFCSELDAIELADQVAHEGAVRGASRVDAHHEDPCCATPIATDTQRKQIRAFPQPLIRVKGAERAQVCPVLEVVGSVDDDLTRSGLDRDHDPVAIATGDLVPKHFRIAEGGGIAIQDRVATVLRPRHARVDAECQRLCLPPIWKRARVNGDERRILPHAETRRVCLVNDDRTRVDLFSVVVRDG